MIKNSKKAITKKIFLYEALFIVAFLLSSFWLFSAIRSENFSLEQIYSKNGAYIFILSLIALIVSYLNRDKLKDCLSSVIRFLGNNIVAVFGIMVLFQIVTLLFASGLSGYDVYGVYHAAMGDINSQKWTYLQNYTNNFLLFLFMRVVHSLTLLQILNIIAIDFSIAMSYFTAKHLFDKQTARYSILLFIATLGFSPWFLNTYSDTFVLPFVSLGIFFLTQWSQDNISAHYRLISLLSAGFFSSIAYYLKPSAIIFVIAYFLISMLKLRKLKPFFISFLVFIIGALVFAMPFTLYKNNQNYVQFDKNKAFPMTHFLMLGISKNGMYNVPDVRLTRSAKTAKEKKEVNIEVFKQRLKQLGTLGYVKFLYGKYCKTVRDGAYAWGADGAGKTGFLVTPNLNPSEKLSPFIHSNFGKFLRSFIYTDSNGKGYANGKNTFFYRFFAQIIYIIMIFGIFLSTLKSKYDFKVMWLLLSMIGLMLFLLLFEGGRSRYLIQALPVLVILAAYGYHSKFASQDLKNG